MCPIGHRIEYVQLSLQVLNFYFETSNTELRSDSRTAIRRTAQSATISPLHFVSSLQRERAGTCKSSRWQEMGLGKCFQGLYKAIRQYD